MTEQKAEKSLTVPLVVENIFAPKGKKPCRLHASDILFSATFFFFSLGTSNPTPTQLALVAVGGREGEGRESPLTGNLTLETFFSFGPTHPPPPKVV